MNQKELDREWAWEHVEALVDGSLDRADRERMTDALRGDPHLRAAVERARALHRMLGRAPAAPVPRGLRGRLLAVPRGEGHGRSGFSWLALPVAAAAAVAVVTLVLVTRPPETEIDEAQLAAIRDFGIAMTYLQRSAVYTREEVGSIVSAGLLDALTVSRNSLVNEEPNDENGG